MYTVPSIYKLLTSKTLYLLNMMLIIGFIGALDTWYGYRIWLVDEIIFKTLLFALQWWLLRKSLPLGVWIKTGLLATLVMLLINSIIVGPVLQRIDTRFFPGTKYLLMPYDFIFVSMLIFNTLIGIGVGIGQGLLLKQTAYSPRWWIPMSTVAYALTTFWWYYYRVLN